MRIESKLFFVLPKKSLFNSERKPYLFVIAAARIATQSELSVRPFAQQDSASFLKPPFGNLHGVSVRPFNGLRRLDKCEKLAVHR